MLEILIQDLRHAVRTLRRDKGFSAAVIVTLALGLGANAAMFSILDRLLFRPPPFLVDPTTAHRVYGIETYRGKEFTHETFQYARYADLSRWTSAFSSTAAFMSERLAMGSGEDTRLVQVGAVTASFFQFFNAPPALGRYFTSSEDSAQAPTPVVVLAWSYWQTQFGGRRDVVGQRVRIATVVGSDAFTVVGVAPRGFVGVWSESPPVAFIPITAYAAGRRTKIKTEPWYDSYGWTFVSIMGRRKPGVSVARASADLTSAMRRSYEAQRVQNPQAPTLDVARPRALAASILSERGPRATSVARVSTWLGGVALVVLLVACANVANLLLARALCRRREIAVRIALGVSRTRLLSQLLVEALLIAAIAGAAALLVGQWGGAVLRAELLPRTAAAAVIFDGRTIAFVGIAAVCAALLAALAPALQAGRVDVLTSLKAGAREGARQRSRLRSMLLIVQGALSVLLLVGAGLFVRSLQHVRAVRLGYDVDPILVVNTSMRGVQLARAQQAELRTRLLAAAKAIPGVEHAALNNTLPFSGSWNIGLVVAGIDSAGRLGDFDLNAVSPEYFATMRTRVVRGRAITDEDRQNAPGAMVVTEAMAERLWPGRDPIGQCVRLSNPDPDTECTYVVGVAENVADHALGAGPALYYYLSAAQFFPENGSMVVRARGDPTALGAALRQRLQREMPGAAYVTVMPYAEILGRVIQSWRLGATMFVAFGALALVLAGIGLYSVAAYDVAQRSHELGVRIALGARVRDVLRLVMTEGVEVGLVAACIGCGTALLAGGWIAPLLFRESARDPVVYGLVVALLLGALLVGCLVPALRAARVDPNVALRAE
jgi:predicted permease